MNKTSSLTSHPMLNKLLLLNLLYKDKWGDWYYKNCGWHFLKADEREIFTIELFKQEFISKEITWWRRLG